MEHQIGIFNKFNSSEFLASFSISESTVSVLPQNESSAKQCKELSSNSSKTTDSWLYGFSDNHAIAVLLKKNTVPFWNILSQHITFRSPMIIRSDESVHEEMNSYSFNSIQFKGGIIDLLYPRSLAFINIGKDSKDQKTSNYTLSYPLTLNGEELTLEYSIDIGYSNELFMVPDICITHSTITLKFQQEKPFSEIEKYYSYILSLCEFCSGFLNVGFEIRIFSDKDHLAYSTRFLDIFDDYAEKALHSSQVMSLKNLGRNVTNLLRVLVDEKTTPRLLFLPNRTIDSNQIKYTDVTDICVAITREYDLLNLPYQANNNEIKDITDDITKLLESKQISEALIGRIKGLLGQLKSPSPKTKICMLYDHFYSYFEMMTSNITGRTGSSNNLYSQKDFSALVSDFVDIRNKTAHVGIVWNKGAEIFIHLKMLVYLSVLSRAGCTKEQCVNLLEPLFYSLFI